MVCSFFQAISIVTFLVEDLDGENFTYAVRAIIDLVNFNFLVKTDQSTIRRTYLKHTLSCFRRCF